MQSRTSRDPQPTNAGVRALASGNGIVNATVAVLLEWSPETPERITLSLFGYPFMSNQSYELQAVPRRHEHAGRGVHRQRGDQGRLQHQRADLHDPGPAPRTRRDRQRGERRARDDHRPHARRGGEGVPQLHPAR